jgi:hypothetical protein
MGAETIGYSRPNFSVSAVVMLTSLPSLYEVA